MVACLPLLALAGCDALDYHPYYADFDGTKHINERNIALIEQKTAGRDSIRFAVISDTQRWYDETALCVKSINAAAGIDFVVHCGDLTDFGVTEEFEWMRDELEKLQVPYVCLIGNHDHLGNGYYTFVEMYGETNFSFNAGDTHFACFNTNSKENDYFTDIPDFAFMQSDQDSLPSSVRRTVVAMHAAPFSDQFNNNVGDVWEERIQRYPNLQLCLCGHEHATKVFYPFDDGVPYYMCGAAKGRQYLIFTLTREGGVGYEVVDY